MYSNIIGIVIIITNRPYNRTMKKRGREQNRISFFSPFGCCACDGARSKKGKKKNRRKKTAYLPPARPFVKGSETSSACARFKSAARARVLLSSVDPSPAVAASGAYIIPRRRQKTVFFLYTFSFTEFRFRVRACYYFFSDRPFYVHTHTA